MLGEHVRAPRLHTFPHVLFVFPPQSEVATGVKKSGPLPGPEVVCRFCPLFSGGDTSRSRCRMNLPVTGSPGTAVRSYYTLARFSRGLLVSFWHRDWRTFSLDPMTAPTPLQMATLSSQATVT